VTLDIKPEIAAALEALASAEGLSLEAFLERLVEKELSQNPEDGQSEGSGMVLEDGLLVYRTGKPLPSHLVDDGIRKVREERDRRILGTRP